MEQVDEIIRTDSTCSIWALPARAVALELLGDELVDPLAVDPVVEPVVFDEPLPVDPVLVALMPPPIVPLISTS